MIVIGQRAASARANALFPAAVGPLMTGMKECSSTAKAALELVPGEMHDRRAAMDVARGQLRSGKGDEQRAHLAGGHDITRLDCRLARDGRGQALMTGRGGRLSISGERRKRFTETTLGVEP